MNKNIKLKFTKEIPTKEGYYWWTNFGEHTPTIVEVVKKPDGNLYASNEEFSIDIKPSQTQRELIAEWRREFGENPEKVDGYYFGEELWCYIECPVLPNGKTTHPSSY